MIAQSRMVTMEIRMMTMMILIMVEQNFADAWKKKLSAKRAGTTHSWKLVPILWNWNDNGNGNNINKRGKCKCSPTHLLLDVGAQYP